MEDSSLKFLDMYNSIYSMRQDLDRLRKPIGNRENPGRTCRDLYLGHPQFEDGKKYKLDMSRNYSVTPENDTIKTSKCTPKFDKIELNSSSWVPVFLYIYFF